MGQRTLWLLSTFSCTLGATKWSPQGQNDCMDNRGFRWLITPPITSQHWPCPCQSPLSLCQYTWQWRRNQKTKGCYSGAISQATLHSGGYMILKQSGVFKLRSWRNLEQSHKGQCISLKWAFCIHISEYSWPTGLYPLMTTVTVQHLFFCFWPTFSMADPAMHESSWSGTCKVCGNQSSRSCNFCSWALILNDQESHKLSYSCCLTNITLHSRK